MNRLEGEKSGLEVRAAGLQIDVQAATARANEEISKCQSVSVNYEKVI